MSMKLIINSIVAGFLFIATCLGFGCKGSENQLTDSKGSLTNQDQGSISTQEFTLAADQLSYEEHYAIVMEHTRELDGIGILVLDPDSDGPAVPIQNIRGGEALELASLYYAISTLDFTITLADLIGNGFWPYDSIPDGVTEDMLVYGFSSHTPVASIPGILTGGSDINSARWTTDARRRILNAYYIGCNTDEEAVGLNSLSKVEAFWINPFNLQPMTYGENPGDLYKSRFDKFVQSMPNSRLDNYDEGITLDRINVQGLRMSSEDNSIEDHGKPNNPNSGFTAPTFIPVKESASPVNPCQSYTSPLKQASSDRCCLFESYTVVNNYMHQYSHSWCCPCTPTTEHCCDYEWTFSGNSIYTTWVFVDCVECDYDPAQGEIVVASGGRAPSTTYSWVGMVTSASAVCDPPTYCTLMADPCWSDRDDFWDNITNASPLGGGTSHPGAICDC